MMGAGGGAESPTQERLCAVIENDSSSPGSTATQKQEGKEEDATPTIATQYGFTTKSIVSDGNCLFHAVADQLQSKLNISPSGAIAPYEVLRRIAANHIIENKTLYQKFTVEQTLEAVEKLIEGVDKEGEWAGDEALSVLSRALQLTIVVIQDQDNSEVMSYKPNNSQGTIYLYYKNRNHYESLYGDPTQELKQKLEKNTADTYISSQGVAFSELLDSTSRAMGEENKKPLAPPNQHKTHVSEETPVGLAVTALSILPSELHSVIYDYVGGAEYLKLLALNSEKDNEEELQSYFRAIDSFVFDGDKWRKYYGEVGEEPPIPKHLLNLYGQNCKLWPGQKVYDTHLLTLIPATVNCTPLTLNSFSELIQHPKERGHGTKYRYYSDDVKKEFGGQPAGPSHWVLMTRDVVEGSRNKSYTDQQALVVQKAKTLGIDYSLVPILSGVVSTLCHHVATGEKLFPTSPNTYTRCAETLASGRPLVFGDFDSSGLSVDGHYGNAYGYHGVAGAVAGR
jgi:hypothetical protein